MSRYAIFLVTSFLLAAGPAGFTFAQMQPGAKKGPEMSMPSTDDRQPVAVSEATRKTPMTEAFVCNIDRFVNDEGVDLVAFQKGQRKDDVTQKYVRKFTRREGVLYVGKAQEKARVMRTERRCSRFTGGTYPWIVESTAMVNHYYFYCVDEDFVHKNFIQLLHKAVDQGL